MIDFLNMLGVWWGWVTFGVILMALELIVPGTFIIWFGCGAVATGIVAWLFELSLVMQLMLFAIFSCISIAIGLAVYKKIFGETKQKGLHNEFGAQKYIGQSFKVVEPIVEGSGKIAVGDTVWLAKSNKDIEKGKMVKVIDAKGTVLIVE